MLEDINIISLHFFLWSGALSSIYSYVSVYAEHYANAGSNQYGWLNMVLPFLTIASNIFVCSLADRRQAHRSVFLCFLLVALVGYGSYAILPFYVAPHPKSDGLNLPAWIVICAITTISTIAMAAVTCLGDTLAVNSSSKRGISYGMIRVWGTLGWGIGSCLLSYINQSCKWPLLIPGLFMTIVLLLIDLLATTFWPHKDDFQLERPPNAATGQVAVPVESKTSLTDASSAMLLTDVQEKQSLDIGCCCNGNLEDTTTKQTALYEPSSFKVQWRLFREVASRRRSIFVYLTLFVLSGAIMSQQWLYFILYLQEIHRADFAFVSSFALMCNAIAELPFFALAGPIINTLGRYQTLALSFVSIGARYLLYMYLLPNSSVYLVIISESFQGPCFSLFYVVMTEVANDYSQCEAAIEKVMDEGLVSNNPDNVDKLRQALRATMQSIVSSCYEGLGLGIGSIAGGLIIHYYGFANLWFFSALVGLLVGLSSAGVFAWNSATPM